MRTFRTFALSTVAALCLAVPAAHAADVSTYKPNTSNYVSTIKTYDWSGFYIGANGGAGFATGSLNGGFVGVQAGYNWQNGRWVFGPEADFQLSMQKTSATSCGGGLCVDETDKLTRFGTLRGRVGYAFDNWLPYVTAGWAFGTVKEDGTVSGLVSGPISGSNNRSGWTVGTGLEWGFATKWSAKVEYLYSHFGGFTNDYRVGNALLTEQYPDVHNHMVRVGINYHF